MNGTSTKAQKKDYNNWFKLTIHFSTTENVDVTEEFLDALCSPYGIIGDTIIRSHQRSMSPQFFLSGYGVVFFHDEAGANRAFQALHGQVVQTLRLSCTLSPRPNDVFHQQSGLQPSPNQGHLARKHIHINALSNASQRGYPGTQSNTPSMASLYAAQESQYPSLPPPPPLQPQLFSRGVAAKPATPPLSSVRSRYPIPVESVMTNDSNHLFVPPFAADVAPAASSWTNNNAASAHSSTSAQSSTPVYSSLFPTAYPALSHHGGSNNTPTGPSSSLFSQTGSMNSSQSFSRTGSSGSMQSGMSGLGGGLSVGVGVYHPGLSGFSMSSDALTSLESHSHSFTFMSSSSSTVTPRHHFQNPHAAPAPAPALTPAPSSQSTNQPYLRSKMSSYRGLMHNSSANMNMNQMSAHSSSQSSLLSSSLYNMSMHNLMQSNMMPRNNVAGELDEPVDAIQLLLQSTSTHAEDDNYHATTNNQFSNPPGLNNVN